MVTTWDVTPYVKEVRKIYSTSFQTIQLKKSRPKMIRVMKRMIDIIESRRHHGAIDFQQLCVQFTLDVLGALAFDMNLGGLDGTQNIQRKIIQTGHVARQNAQNPLSTLYCHLFPKSKTAREKQAIIQSLTDEWDVITQEVLKKEDPPDGETPLWYTLKTMKDPETNAPLTYNGLRSEIAGVIVAGMDTTGHQLAWALGLLAGHPKIADKLYDELKKHGLCGSNAREVTIDDMGELDYLNALIKEVFRIAHIGALGSLKSVPRDMTILGYRVPKNTVIVLPNNRALNTEEQWSDPHVVRPERWLTNEDMSKKYYRTFAAGPRDCIGQKLAMLELRYAIVTLVSMYHMSMDCTFEELLDRTAEGIAVEAKGGVNIHVTPRSV